MPIRVVRGDLLSATEGYIVHGVNCQGVMGSGVALAIKNRYPEVYHQYKDFLWAKRLDYIDPLGRINAVVINDKLTVINAFTQKYYGRDSKQYASYDAIEEVFSRLTYINTSTIHMPKIGCGLGGADWNVVEKLLRKYLGDHDVIVYEL